MVGCVAECDGVVLAVLLYGFERVEAVLCPVLLDGVRYVGEAPVFVELLCFSELVVGGLVLDWRVSPRSMCCFGPPGVFELVCCLGLVL